MDSSATFNEKLHLLLAEYQAALAAGQPLSVQDLLRRHTDVDPVLAQALTESIHQQATLGVPNSTPQANGPQAATLSSAGIGKPGATLSSPQVEDAVFNPISGQFGEYQLLEELARGGMGVVFKAHHKSMGRDVALKMILAGTFASPEQLRRFHLEAEEAGRLDHPHIVPIYQVGEHRGQHYFTMKLIEGGSLAQWITECKTQGAGGGKDRHVEIAQLIVTVARAVHHAHQRGVLHRDLKPGNILLQRDRSAKRNLQAAIPMVADFGLAKHLGARDSDTLSGAVVGTPSYMAPEQAAARKDLSTAVDVYALGAVLYELLAGRPPFQAANPLDTVLQVLEQEPKPLRSFNAAVDRDLETICLKCLAKEPGARYGSAEELALDLERWLANEPIRARPVGAMERAKKWVRRRPAVAALMMVSAVAIVGLAVLGWFDNLRLQAAWQGEQFAREAAETNADEARRQRATAETKADEARQQRAAADANAAVAEANANEARKQRAAAETHAEDARRQRLAAEASAAEARQQRDAANANFRKRQETLDSLFIRFDRRLENFAGADSVRMEFLNEFLRLNESLLKERGQEPEVRRQTAQLQLRIADLDAQRNVFVESQLGYKKAIVLFAGLAKDGLATEEDRTFLAHSHMQLAQLQRRARLFVLAQASFEEAIRLRELLIADYPNKPIHRYRTANYRFLLADDQEEMGQAKKAEALYRRALAEQKKLVKEYPGEPLFQQGLLETAGSLAVLLEPTNPDETQRLLEQITRGYWPSLKPKSAVLNPNAAYMSGYDLAEHLQRRGLHAEMVRLSAEITAEFSTNSDIHYHAGCYVARAIPALDVDKGLAAADRVRLADTYAKQAVELLRRAVQLGWKDRGQFFLDADLDPLRARADFRDLLADLDKLVGTPQTLDQLLLYLANRYRNEQADYQANLASARTVAERKKANANWPKPEEYAQRFLTLAEENPKEAAAVTSLGNVILIASTPPLANTPKGTKLAAQAFTALERDHMESAALAAVLNVLGTTPTKEGDRLLRTAFEKHKLAEVRGQAGFWLARSLAMQADGSPKDSEAFRQAEEQFEKVARDYGAQPHGTTTLGEAANSQLHALRHLMIGRPAEDIVGIDLEGQPLKLSDFRGKVVLLDFWANWCGFCRQMYPYEKAVAKRLKDAPFALVGVNCDKDKTELQREANRQGITWKSWWDEDGRISSRWQMQSLPLIYLIDHRGVIRKQFVGVTRGEVIDAEIQALLKEIPAPGVK